MTAESMTVDEARGEVYWWCANVARIPLRERYRASDRQLVTWLVEHAAQLTPAMHEAARVLGFRIGESGIVHSLWRAGAD
jgi:hypothetical protein